MNVRHMFPTNRVEAEDVRDITGGFRPLVVTISEVTFKTRQADSMGDAKVDWYLSVLELKKPIRFTAVGGYQLAEILGSEESEDWVGRRVGLEATQVMVHGKVRLLINFSDIGNAPPSLPAHTDITAFRNWSESDRERLFKMLPEGSMLRESPSGPALPPGEPTKPLGEETAAKIIVALGERGRRWEDLVEHLKGKSLGHLIEGLNPWDCPESVKSHAKAFCHGLEVTNKLDDAGREAEQQRVLGQWRPPVESQAGPAELPPDDDIPF